MKIIPWEHTFEIHSLLSRDGARRRLAQRTGTSSDSPVSGPMEFLGDIYDTGFSIKEAGSPVSAFLPVFHGTFEGDEDVVMKVRAANGVSVIAVIFSWSAALVMFYQTFFLLSRVGYGATHLLFFLLQGIGYLGLGFFLSLFYWHKTKKGERFFRKLFGEG